MNAEDTFIADVLAAPGDPIPRRGYADWLDERADPRGGYLRAEATWAQAGDRQAEMRLRETAAKFDAVWVARVSRPPVGVCADHLRFHEPHDMRPKRSAADLDWVENHFGITLSADYRAFLLNYNGGRPEPSHLRLPGRAYREWDYDDVVSLSTVWAAAESPIDCDCDLVWHLQMMGELRGCDDRWREEEPHRDLMIIGKGPPSGELEWFSLGCRGAVLGRVYYVAPFLSGPEAEDCRLAAPTFAAFLGMLTDYDPDHVKAAKAGDAAALRRWLDVGGDPNEVYRGMPLLTYGVIYSRPAIVRELLAAGANIYEGLLAQAKHEGCQEVIDLLRSHLRTLRPKSP
jgi:uncharacterized protein (TIGR02996 family)